MAQRDVTIRISATDNFSQVMQKYNTEMDKAEKNTKDLGKSSDGLAKAIGGLFTIALVQQIGNYVSAMMSLGKEANASESRFRALTATMGSYDETMQGLRASTLGVVDDMHLQQGAMLLIQTAGIRSNEELERMMGLITRLKKPSEDMTDAINNFGLMLANNSILRLDSFGISASRVRARILELQAELGVDRSTAFRMAVLEEGEKNLRKFGDAAEAAGTASSRFGTKITNVLQDIAQAGAEGLEGWFLFFDYIDKKAAHDAQQVEKLANVMSQTLLPMTGQMIDMFSGRWNEVDLMGMQGVGSSNFILNFTEQAIEAAQKDPSLLRDIEGFRSYLFKQMSEGSPQQINELLAVGDSGLFSGMVAAIAPLLQGVNTVQEVSESTAATQIRLRDIISDQNALYVDQAHYIDIVHQKSMAAAAAEAFAAERKNVILSTYMSALGTTGGDAMSAGFRYQSRLDEHDTGMLPEYLTQGQAGEIQAAAEQARMLADNMAAAAEAEEGLFSDEEVERVSAYASNLEDMADEAEKAAEAFENMSLAEMFNQTDGGRIGEMFDVIIDKMKEAGAETWELNNAQRALDLRSGELTTSAAAFQDQIAPHLAQLMFSGQENLVNEITREYEELMMGAQLRGINVDSPEFVDMATSTFTNPLFNPREFDSEAFLAGFQPAADAAGTLSTDSTTATDNFNLMSEKTPLIAADIGLMETSMGAMVGHTDKVKEAIEGLSKTKVTIPVQFEWLNIGGIVSLIMPGLIQAVQQAGGIMPGTDTRASVSVASGSRPF